MSGNGWGGAAEGLGGFFQGMGQVMVQQRMFEQESARMMQMQSMQFANQMSLEQMRQSFDRERLGAEREERALDRQAAREALHFELDKIREEFKGRRGLAELGQQFDLEKMKKQADMDIGKFMLQFDITNEADMNKLERIFEQEKGKMELGADLNARNESMGIFLRGKMEKELKRMDIGARKDELQQAAELEMQKLKANNAAATDQQLIAAAIKGAFDHSSDDMTTLMLAKMHNVTLTKDESGQTQIQGSNKDVADFMRARAALQTKGASSRIAGAMQALNPNDPAQAAKINQMFEEISRADTKTLDDILKGTKGGAGRRPTLGSESRPAGPVVAGSETTTMGAGAGEEEDEDLDTSELAVGLGAASRRYLKDAFSRANVSPTQKADVLTTKKNVEAGGRTLFGAALTPAGTSVLNALNENDEDRHYGFDNKSGSFVDLPSKAELTWPGSETEKVSKSVSRYGVSKDDPYGDALKEAKKPNGLRELQEKWSGKKVGSAQKPIIKSSDELTKERLTVLLRLEAADKALVGDNWKKEERAIADQYRVDETREKLRGGTTSRGSESR